MVRLNKETRTITGELLTPYLVEESNVYCWNQSGKTVAKKMKDFSLDNSIAVETMIGGASVIPVSPVYKKTTKIIPQQPIVETEISRPTLEASITSDEVPVESPITSINGPTAVTVSPDEAEDDKITYVHVKPAVDDFLGDGELQVGGVEVVDAEEAEGRIEFIPIVDDDDYI